MKKFLLSLIGVLGTLAAANAQTWVAPELGSDNIAPNTELFDNDDATITTVYSAKVTDYSATIGDYSFSSAIQLRIDAAPSTNNLAGTEKADCTPLIINAKTDATLSVYYRRQANNGAYVAGDGKDIHLIDQNGLTEIGGEITLHSEKDGYGIATQVYYITADHTYTLYARGTTGQLFGLDIIAGDAPEVTEFLYENAAPANENGFSQITYSDGARLVLLNSGKNWSNGSSITLNNKKHTSIKLSNGAQNIFLAPEGKLIQSVTFYSYVNADNGEAYWKEVANTAYTAEDGLMKSFKDYANPDAFTYDLGGVRSFTFTNAGKQLCFVLDVTYVAAEDMPAVETFPLTLKAVDNGIAYGTVALPFNVNKPAGIEVFSATLSGDKLTLVPYTGSVLPAGVGFILKAQSAEALTVDAERNTASASAMEPTDNDLQATGEIPVPAPANSYVLAKKGGEVSFCKADSKLLIPAYKAYIVAASASGAPIRIVDDATAISTIQAEQALARQLFDLQGRQVRSAQGLHIQGGKVQFVK